MRFHVPGLLAAPPNVAAGAPSPAAPATDVSKSMLNDWALADVASSEVPKASASAEMPRCEIRPVPILSSHHELLRMGGKTERSPTSSPHDCPPCGSRPTRPRLRRYRRVTFYKNRLSPVQPIRQRN